MPVIMNVTSGETIYGDNAEIIIEDDNLQQVLVNGNKVSVAGFGVFKIKKIEYGIDDYLYAVSGARCNKKSYHKLKIYNGNYVKLHGYKIPLDECMCIN